MNTIQKYKKKYFKSMKDDIIPLYTLYSKLETSKIKLNILNELMSQALKTNRFFHTYTDMNGNNLYEGIDIIKGPNGFNIKKIDTENLGIEQYETSIIYKYLIEFNNLLKKHNVRTIQSSISYYLDDEKISLSYFQVPFIEFIGHKNTIPIMKKIINHSLASTYLSFTIPNIYKDNQVIRTTLLRPYVDFNGNKINDFDDTDFWDTILIIIKSISDENITLQNITSNDLELDNNKPWFIIDPYGNIEQIHEDDKNKFNPFFQKIPLSTLDVRYNNNTESFMKKIN